MNLREIFYVTLRGMLVSQADPAAWLGDRREEMLAFMSGPLRRRDRSDRRTAAHHRLIHTAFDEAATRLAAELRGHTLH